MQVLLDAVRETRRRIGDTGSAYECGFCSLTFEEERLNCPACGFSAIRKVN